MPKEETMNRTLRIEIPQCAIGKGLEDDDWTAIDGLNGWQLVQGLYPAWEGTIDLSGYTRDHKTFYPEGGVIQEGPYYGEVGCDGTIVYTVVSTIPIDLENLVYQCSTINGGLGFMNLGFTAAILDLPQQNWETVMFAQSEMLVTNSNISPNSIGICEPITLKQSGSLAPTATDTLYIGKVVVGVSNFSSSTSCVIPASRIVLAGMIGEEPDVEYLMRLKRSVELANQV